MSNVISCGSASTIDMIAGSASHTWLPKIHLTLRSSFIKQSPRFGVRIAVKFEKYYLQDIMCVLHCL